MQHNTQNHKAETLEQIKNLIASGELNKEEVIDFVSGLASLTSIDVNIDKKSSKKLEDDSKNTLVTKTLYVVGGIITLSGVLVLLSNNWDAIGFIGQWCITIGLGLALYINACITARKNDFDTLSQVLFTVSSVLLLWGGYVWYDHLFMGSAYTYFATGSDLATESISIGSILFIIFASALYVLKKPVLHVVSAAFFTLTYYSVVVKLLEKYSDIYGDKAFVVDIGLYSMILIGAGYVAYGYWLKDLRRISNVFSFFGFGTVLLAGLLFGDIWDFLYAFLAIGSIALSIRLKNSIGLILTSVAIGAYCIKISIKYFLHNLGFPFILLCSGLLIIGLGYLTYYLNKKYITQK